RQSDRGSLQLTDSTGAQVCGYLHDSFGRSQPCAAVASPYGFAGRARIHTSAGAPGISRPGVVTELAGSRHGVKSPDQFATFRIVGPNDSQRSTRLATGDYRPADHEISVHPGGDVMPTR